MMKRGIVFLAIAAVLLGQIATVNNEPMSAARVKINANFAYLDAKPSVGATGPSGAAGAVGATGAAGATGATGPGLTGLTSGYVPVATGATTMVNSGLFQLSGKFGIGLTVPLAKLHVQGPAAMTSFTGTTTGAILVDGGTATGEWSTLDFKGSNTNIYGRIGILRTAGGALMSFGTTNSYSAGVANQALTIGETGNVGIGTTAPTYGRLQVDISSAGITVPLTLTNTVTSANGSGSQLRFMARRANTDIQDFSYINSVVTDNTTSSEDARLTLGTMVAGTLTDTLTATGGNVGIGTTAPASILESSKTGNGYWTGADWNGTLLPAQALTVTALGTGYDPVLIGRMTTSTAVSKPAFAIGATATGAWTDGTLNTQTADIYVVNRDNAGALKERLRITSGGTTSIGPNVLGMAATVAGAADTGLSRVAAGVVGVGTGAAGSAAGRIALDNSTPANAAAACTAQSVWADANYIYVCVASGNIKRVAIATW